MGSFQVAEPGAVVVPAGAGLVPASPSGPVQSVGDAVQTLVDQDVQPLDLRDGERDQPGILGGFLVGTGRRRRCGAGVPQAGGGNGADRQGGHDQCQVPHDRAVEADLGVVVAELVLPELVIFPGGPPAAADFNQDREAGRAAFGHEAPEEVDAGGVAQVAADQQVTAAVPGGDPGPGITAVAFGPGAAGG